MSKLTTHVLDTSTGKPADGIAVILEINNNGSWKKIGEGITNADGRISALTAADAVIENGTYRLLFETAAYFNRQNKKSFYPKVSIEFTVTDNSHHHVPLLLSPFGYSTYRGS